jgi:hypothetical protein
VVPPPYGFITRIILVHGILRHDITIQHGSDKVGAIMLIRDELIREKTVKPPAALIVTPSPLNHQPHHLSAIQLHDSWFPVTVADRGPAYGAYTIFVTMDSNYAIPLVRFRVL